MGIVTAHLLQRIVRLINQQHVVVWYDPEKHYADFAQSISLPDVEIAQYQGSFFQLRYDIEPHIAAENPPRLLVYVAMDRSASGNALVEAERAGAVLEPNGSGGLQDTSLETIGRSALVGVLAPNILDEVLNNKNLSLADLDRIAQQSGPVTGVLSLIFGAAVSPLDIALNFLTQPDLDQEIKAKSAQEELVRLLQDTFGLPETVFDHLNDLRAYLTRHLLLTEFKADLPEETGLRVLGSVPSPAHNWQVKACQRLVARWRDSFRLRGEYEKAAQMVEEAFRLSEIEVNWEDIQNNQTFPFVEGKLIVQAEKWIQDGEYTKAMQLAEARQSSFWSVENTALQWSLLALIAALRNGILHVSRTLNNKARSAGEIIKAYTIGENDSAAWHELDTIHRHLERLYTSAKPSADIDQHVQNARNAYFSLINKMAERYQEALVNQQFLVENVQSQIQIFHNQVRPLLQTTKVAYFLVDALRFEMAKELVDSLSDTSQATLLPALAIAPTITEIGMAALLPGAEYGLELVEVNGKLAVEVKGNPLKVRGERMDYVNVHGGYIAETFTLGELQKPNRIAKERIERAQLIVVTSQEIDQIAEEQAPYLAKSMMDDLLIHLRSAMHNLVDEGVGVFVLAADHGFVFGDEISSDMLIEPPDAKPAKLNQRVWVGKGGKTPTGCLRFKASELGLGGDLECVFPPGLSAFKVTGGADPYFHGGLSLQEMIIPVAMVQLRAVQAPLAKVDYSLTMERPLITSRLFTIAAYFSVKGLFDAPHCRVICVAKYKGETIAKAVAAGYGFDQNTSEVTLEKEKTNYITLMLTKEINNVTVKVHLLDSDTQAELAHLGGIKVDIAI
jgi:hypothetical protein